MNVFSKLNRFSLFSAFFAFAIFAVVAGATEYRGRLVEGEWQESWDQALIADIQQSQLLDFKEPKIEQLCRGYGADPRKRMTFWHQLFIGLSWKESLHGSDNYVYFNRGVNVGLFQIDPRLKSAYGCTGNLYDAVTNISCAVKMADDLVYRYKSFLLGSKQGMAAYWQPLRSMSSADRANRKFILKHVQQACQTGEISYISTSDNLAPEAADLSTHHPSAANTIEDLNLDPNKLESHPEELASPPAVPSFRIAR